MEPEGCNLRYFIHLSSFILLWNLWLTFTMSFWLIWICQLQVVRFEFEVKCQILVSCFLHLDFPWTPRYEYACVFSFSAIFVAVSASRPRADVVYCINALSRRLTKTHNWTVCSWVTLLSWSITASSFLWALACIYLIFNTCIVTNCIF